MNLQQQSATRSGGAAGAIARIRLQDTGARVRSTELGDAAFTSAVEAHAASLRRTLHACVGEPAGRIREADLIQRLKLDRSVLGRVVRALHAQAPTEFLHELPSPEGLALVLRAASTHAGLSAADRTAGEHAIKAFRRFIVSYPGKRRALLLRLASSMPTQRAAADLISRRAMTKAAADLLGYRVKCTVASMIVFDGGDAERFDTIHLFSKYGLERTRPDGPPIIAGSLRTGPAGPACPYMPADPAADPADPTSSLLRDYCSGPGHVEFYETSGGLTELQIPPHEPPLNTPVDIVCAQRAPAVLLKKSRESFTHEWHQVITRMPTDRMVIDLILGPGVYENTMPMVTQSLYRPDPPRPPIPGVRRADELRPYASIDDLGYGLGGVHIHSVNRYRSCLSELIAHAGLNPEACRVVRVTKEHPELNSGMTCWFSLPGSE
ncbi:MAG: hypothetical protein AAGF47_02690 [Planctomycetota bacterium]